jgi:hypothetical protein
VLTLQLQCISGEYHGQTFTLHPRAGAEALLAGRSTGRKFVRTGLSLPEDGEVSTTHGKIEVHSGQVTFTDVGSTNGTTLNEAPLKENVAAALKTGDRLKIGASLFLVKVDSGPAA